MLAELGADVLRDEINGHQVVAPDGGKWQQVLTSHGKKNNIDAVSDVDAHSIAT